MSLLLLFSPPVATPVSTAWVVVATASSGWTVSNYDFYNLWSEWGTTTWGAIASSGYTWDQMAGYTFSKTTGSSTVWVVTS